MLAFGAFSCASESNAPAQHDGGPAGDHSAGLYPSQLPPDFHCDPTLESLVNSVFVTSCAWDYCHGSNSAAYTFVLTYDAKTVGQELVGVPAASCPGWTRVVPGDVEHSFLWKKLTEEKPACGVRMPYATEPLPQTALDCVRGWIESL